MNLSRLLFGLSVAPFIPLAFLAGLVSVAVVKLSNRGGRP